MTLSEITNKVTDMASSADAIGGKIKFHFGDEAVFIDGSGSENVVNNEDAEADTTIKIDMDDFVAMMKGDLNPMNAFMGGKMKIDGDMGLAMKLSSMFS